MDLETCSGDDEESFGREDYCVSGSGQADLKTVALRLLDLNSRYRLSELVVWDRRGQPNRTLFDVDTGPEDMAGVLEFDFDEVSRFLCCFEITLAGVETRMCIAARESPVGTVVEGPIYLNRVPRDGARELAAVLESVVEHLELEFLNVADEDDESLLLGQGLRLPALCGLFRTPLLERFVSRLQQSGATVQPLSSQITIVWLQPSSEQPREAVMALLRDALAAAGYF